MVTHDGPLQARYVFLDRKQAGGPLLFLAFSLLGILDRTCFRGEGEGVLLLTLLWYTEIRRA